MNKKIKIVLAEDDRTFALLLKFRLEKEGFELHYADNGQKAIEIIETVRPDIVLTDIMLPFVNGLEVMTHVRRNLKMDMPIIVFSAAGQEKMVLKSFSLGATDFLRKPFSPYELIIRVKNMTKNVQGQGDSASVSKPSDFVILEPDPEAPKENNADLGKEVPESGSVQKDAKSEESNGTRKEENQDKINEDSMGIPTRELRYGWADNGNGNGSFFKNGEMAWEFDNYWFQNTSENAQQNGIPMEQPDSDAGNVGKSVELDPSEALSKLNTTGQKLVISQTQSNAEKKKIKKKRKWRSILGLKR